MKKILYLIVLVLIIDGITACASENRSTTEPQTTSIASENTGEQEVQNEQSQNEIPQMKIQIGEYIFYAFNFWSYTKLGHVNDLTDWEKALGSGEVVILLLIATTPYHIVLVAN